MTRQEAAMTGALEVYDLRIPGRSFKSTLACPERLLVAWHRDCLGVCELLTPDGRAVFGRPQERLWEVREYRRVECWGTGARYVPVPTANARPSRHAEWTA